MSIVMHLCVCPYVCKSMERKLNLYGTPMYFRYLIMCQILYYIMLFGDNLH